MCKISFLLINPSLQSDINLGLDVIEEVLSGLGVQVDRYDLLSRSTILRKKYDFVGVSFITPMNFFNIYKIKHLLERGIIKIAGGAGVSNPLPISSFFDIFIIGEGEKPLRKIIEYWRQSGKEREVFLTKVSHIPKVYVPSLYSSQI
ncbi:MAG: hypothetical protein ACE5J9_06445 [Methanosarcinales archaeon]